MRTTIVAALEALLFHHELDHGDRVGAVHRIVRRLIGFDPGREPIKAVTLITARTSPHSQNFSIAPNRVICMFLATRPC
jgi:hypothetical protein